jgi:hypothetical protein
METNTVQTFFSQNNGKRFSEKEKADILMRRRLAYCGMVK